MPAATYSCGITILLVEQNARLALQAAHRGYVMESGLITMSGDAKQMLFDRIVYADEVNWIAIPELTGPLRVTARTRYHQVEQAATVYPAECGFRLEFDQPQRAPTPGQAVVLYQGDVVLGGGTIVAVE